MADGDGCSKRSGARGGVYQEYHLHHQLHHNASSAFQPVHKRPAGGCANGAVAAAASAADFPMAASEAAVATHASTATVGHALQSPQQLLANLQGQAKQQLRQQVLQQLQILGVQQHGSAQMRQLQDLVSSQLLDPGLEAILAALPSIEGPLLSLPSQPVPASLQQVFGLDGPSVRTLADSSLGQPLVPLLQFGLGTDIMTDTMLDASRNLVGVAPPAEDNGGRMTPPTTTAALLEAAAADEAREAAAAAALTALSGECVGGPPPVKRNNSCSLLVGAEPAAKRQR